MNLRRESTRRFEPLILSVVTLGAVALLLAQDAVPRLFSERSHQLLAAFSLAMIAFAYLIFQLANRAAAMELTKTMLLAAAFLFWAANQLWPNSHRAGLCNDIAIGLFVLDVFWVISGWPQGSKASFLDESSKDGSERFAEGRDCPCCGRQAV